MGNIEIGQEFYDLIDDENILFGMLADYVEDPENEYDAYHYGMYVVGFLTSSMNSDAMAMFYVPEEVEDWLISLEKRGLALPNVLRQELV